MTWYPDENIAGKSLAVVDIIGKKYSNDNLGRSGKGKHFKCSLLLGVKDRLSTFWSIKDQGNLYLTEQIKTYDEYKFAWWAYVGDVHIKRIIKNV